MLSGEDLKEGQFSFQLKDADGKVLQTAKNAAGGTVGFEAISYDKPGAYTYSISEVNDAQKNVTYDAAEHQVTVMVTDDGAGHLVATVTYDGDVAPVFKNTYTPPTTPAGQPADGAAHQPTGVEGGEAGSAEHGRYQLVADGPGWHRGRRSGADRHRCDPAAPEPVAAAAEKGFD